MKSKRFAPWRAWREMNLLHYRAGTFHGQELRVRNVLFHTEFLVGGGGSGSLKGLKQKEAI